MHPEGGRGPADTDGLLLGTIQISKSTEFADDGVTSEQSRALQSEATHAVITRICSAEKLLSFYDGAGCINTDALLRLCNFSRLHRRTTLAVSVPEGDHNRQPTSGSPDGEEVVIGWFSFRNAVPLRPSMREAAITANLEALRRSFAGQFQQEQYSSAHTHEHESRERGTSSLTSRNSPASAGPNGDRYMREVQQLGPSFSPEDQLSMFLNHSTGIIFLIIRSSWDSTHCINTTDYTALTFPPASSHDTSVETVPQLVELPVSVTTIAPSLRSTFMPFPFASAAQLSSTTSGSSGLNVISAIEAQEEASVQAMEEFCSSLLEQLSVASHK